MKSEWPPKIFWGTGSSPRKSFEVEGVAIENFDYFSTVPPQMHGNHMERVALETVMHLCELPSKKIFRILASGP